MKNKLIFSVGIVLGLIFIDQIIKWAMIKYSAGFIVLNYNFLFSLVTNVWLGYFLIAFALGILFYFLQATSYKLQANFGLLLILSGAISNIIDRLARGAVVDYIPFFFHGTFNLADVFIWLGIILFVWPKRD